MKLNNRVFLIILFVSSLTLFLFFDSNNSITGNVVCPPGGEVGTAPLGNECCAENTCIPPDPSTGRGCSAQYTCSPGLKCKFAQGWTFNGVCEKALPSNATSPTPTPQPSLGELIVDFVPFQPTQVNDSTPDVLLGLYSLNFTGQNVQNPTINFTDFSFEFSGGVDLSLVRVLVDGIYYNGSLASLSSVGGKYKFDLTPYTILLGIGQTREISVIADVSSLPSGTQSIQYTTIISNITSSKFTTKNIKTDSIITIVKSPQQSTQASTNTSSGTQTTTPSSTTSTSQTPTTQTPSTSTTQQPSSPQTSTQPSTQTTTSTSTVQPSIIPSTQSPSPSYSPSFLLPLVQQYSNILPRHKFDQAMPRGAPNIIQYPKKDQANNYSALKIIMSILLFLGILVWILLIIYFVRKNIKKKKQ